MRIEGKDIKLLLGQKNILLWIWMLCCVIVIEWSIKVTSEKRPGDGRTEREREREEELAKEKEYSEISQLNWM